MAQDANYNVLGVIDSSGVLKERYEYTPYGQRTVFFSAGSDDDGCYAPAFKSRNWLGDSWADNFYGGLCDNGHQGLMHDEESGLIYNRARELHASLGRYSQRDPVAYIDGLNSYQYTESTPTNRVDSLGLLSANITAYWGLARSLELYDETGSGVYLRTIRDNYPWDAEAGVSLEIDAQLLPWQQDDGTHIFAPMSESASSTNAMSKAKIADVPIMVYWKRLQDPIMSATLKPNTSVKDGYCVECLVAKTSATVETRNSKLANERIETAYRSKDLIAKMYPILTYVNLGLKTFDIKPNLATQTATFNLITVICADRHRAVLSINHPLPTEYLSGSGGNPGVQSGAYYGTWIHSSPGGETGLLYDPIYGASD